MTKHTLYEPSGEVVGQLLLINDEPGLGEPLKEYLEDSGFVVKMANNLRDRLELSQKSHLDLAIFNIITPEVDGYQLLRELRADPSFEALPSVFLTAREMTPDRIQGYKPERDAYLPKPFDPDELVAIVENLLGRGRSLSGENDSTPGTGEDIYEGCRYFDPPPPRLRPQIEIDLTPREQSILNLVVEGLMNKEIAQRLNTTVRNVEKYISRLFSKTGTNSRTELVRYALEKGWAK